MSFAAALPTFDAPNAPLAALRRSAVVKSSTLREREVRRAQQNQVALETRRRAALADKEQAEHLAARDEQLRIDAQADSARRAVQAITELAGRAGAARDLALQAASRDTIEAAAALAAWFLGSEHVSADPRDPVGAAALAARLRDALEQMLPTVTPVIAVAPADLEEVGAMLGQHSEHGELAIELRADRSLTRGEARIDAGDSHADLTIGGALQRAVEGLIGTDESRTAA